jgi:tRNA-dihydrouridine synthase B
MRRVARAFGCLYAMNEVVLDEHVVQPGKLQQEILHVPDDDHPVAGQLLGNAPETFATAAGLLVKAGYDVVDINFGCPVKKTVGRHRGGYLLSDPKMALEIMARVRDAVPAGVPLTVKMRRAMDDTPQAAERFWEILEGAFALGVDGVCVHGRTVVQRYIGPSRRSFLHDVKQRYPDKCIIGSGDVFSADDAKAMLDATGIDGVWVARGAIGAPWIFSQIRALLEDGTPVAPPSFSEQRRAVWLHYRESIAVYGVELGQRLMRKAAIKYAEAHPQADTVVAAFCACKTTDDVMETLRRYYDESLAEDHFGPVVLRSGPGNLVAAGASCEQ